MILVTGAKGVVGTPLCAALRSKEYVFKAVSRVSSSDENSVQWDLHVDPEPSVKQTLRGVSCLLHCAPIWLLPMHIDYLFELGVRRIVAFSSTSVISKQLSTNQQEQSLVDQLQQAEQRLQIQCEKLQIKLTIFRPSMIYGYGRDQNVSHLASIIRKYRCMILVGRAQGLRQPVHADDLVQAVLAVMDDAKTFYKTYNLAGAETLSYRELVHRIFVGLEMQPRFIAIPLPLFRLGLWGLAKFTRFAYTPDMADRMNQNLTYDYAAASEDFAYQPQAFLLNPSRDLTVVL